MTRGICSGFVPQGFSPLLLALQRGSRHSISLRESGMSPCAPEAGGRDSVSQDQVCMSGPGNGFGGGSALRVLTVMYHMMHYTLDITASTHRVEDWQDSASLQNRDVLFICHIWRLSVLRRHRRMCRIPETLRSPSCCPRAPLPFQLCLHLC